MLILRDNQMKKLLFIFCIFPFINISCDSGGIQVNKIPPKQMEKMKEVFIHFNIIYTLNNWRILAVCDSKSIGNDSVEVQSFLNDTNIDSVIFLDAGRNIKLIYCEENSSGKSNHMNFVPNDTKINIDKGMLSSNNNFFTYPEVLLCKRDTGEVPFRQYLAYARNAKKLGHLLFTKEFENRYNSCPWDEIISIYEENLMNLKLFECDSLVLQKLNKDYEFMKKYDDEKNISFYNKIIESFSNFIKERKEHLVEIKYEDHIGNEISLAKECLSKGMPLSEFLTIDSSLYLKRNIFQYSK